MKHSVLQIGIRICSLLIVGLWSAGCQSSNEKLAHFGDSPTEVSTAKQFTLEGGIVVNIHDGEVLIPGKIALDRGWLEVVACIEGTREHEAIFVTAVQPVFVHAALLLIGAEPGAPARYDAHSKTSTLAYGTKVHVAIEWEDSGENICRRPVCELVEIEGQTSMPEFVFAGSLTLPNPPSKGPGEYYVADYGGTVVGLATFGDEVVATKKVHSPDLGIQPAAWRIAPGELPPPGTPARLVLNIDRTN